MIPTLIEVLVRTVVVLLQWGVWRSSCWDSSGK